MAKNLILMAKCRIGVKNSEKNEKSAHAKDMESSSGPMKAVLFFKKDGKIT